MVSLLEPGRFRLSSTSTRGSRWSSERSCHPCLIFTLARASRFCSVRVTYKDVISTQCPRGPTRESYLGDLGPPQHPTRDLCGLITAVGVGHGGGCSEPGLRCGADVGVLLQVSRLWLQA